MGRVQTEWSRRLVILGSSGEGMGSPAGPDLLGLRPLQTDCSNSH